MSRDYVLNTNLQACLEKDATQITSLKTCPRSPGLTDVNLHHLWALFPAFPYPLTATCGSFIHSFIQQYHVVQASLNFSIW